MQPYGNCAYLMLYPRQQSAVSEISHWVVVFLDNSDITLGLYSQRDSSIDKPADLVIAFYNTHAIIAPCFVATFLRE